MDKLVDGRRVLCPLAEVCAGGNAVRCRVEDTFVAKDGDNLAENATLNVFCTVAPEANRGYNHCPSLRAYKDTNNTQEEAARKSTREYELEIDRDNETLDDAGVL